ncbi:hypothetical protein [Nocardia sp. SC052]|uniref:hypothetical protein n=1 Tax=Nocardia sichangensis TaxID=3385975 RepID=UPI00399F3B00
MANMTELFLRVHLRDDTPAGLLDWLEKIAAGNDLEAYDAHPFFACRRWHLALTGVDEISTPIVGPPLAFGRGSVDGYELRSMLTVHSAFRHYDGEVAAFLDWITQFVDADPGDFLGYSLYEDGYDGEPEMPTLIHMPRR